MDSCAKLVRDSSSPFDSILFDLDDTLYPFNTGIAKSVQRNIEDFLVEKCGFPEKDAPSLRVELFKKYGSTLAGLRALGYDISADDYHSYVHGRLPYDRIKPDSQLRNMLHSIRQRKIIFTNSDQIHATKALARLGLENCFDQIICFETLNPNLPNATRPDEIPIVLKPSLDALKIAIEVANVNPHRTLFLDDSVRNIAAGKNSGLHTALVGKTVKTIEADFVLESINNLPQVIPDIWASKPKGENNSIMRTGSDLEAVLTATPVGA